MIDFYILFLKKTIYKSFIYNTSLIFMQFILETKCKSLKFTMIINFYAFFLGKKMYKSFI